VGALTCSDARAPSMGKGARTHNPSRLNRQCRMRCSNDCAQRGGWVGGGGTPIDVAGRAYTEAAEVAVSLQHRRLHLSAQCPHVVCVPKWHGSGSAGKSSSELMEAAASHLSGSGSGSGARPALSAHSFMAVYSQPIGDHRIRWFVRVIKGTSSRSWWQNSSRRNSFGSLRRSLCNNGPSGPSLWRVIS
jgi:hypothetical protein